MKIEMLAQVSELEAVKAKSLKRAIAGYDRGDLHVLRVSPETVSAMELCHPPELLSTLESLPWWTENATRAYIAIALWDDAEATRFWRSRIYQMVCQDLNGDIDIVEEQRKEEGVAIYPFIDDTDGGLTWEGCSLEIGNDDIDLEVDDAIALHGALTWLLNLQEDS